MAKSSGTPLITVSGLSQQSPEQQLFEDLSCGLNVGDRIGLVGHNGCGKSTFLNLLAGRSQPNEGSISVSRAAIVSCVEQHLPNHLIELSLADAVREALPADKRDWMSWKVDIKLPEIGFEPHQSQVLCKDLSGGQVTRLMLARALMSEPNLLLLDEPSNHLDLPTIIWLENFLKSWKGSFLIISHDANLLDAVTTHTWVLQDRKLQAFNLPCTTALQVHQVLLEGRISQREAESKEIKRVEASAKRIAEWGKTFDNPSLSRKAKSMEKLVDHMKEDQTEAVDGYPWNLSIGGEKIQADRLVQLKNLPITPAGVPVILYRVEERVIRPGDRIAVMGANGSGKSSLLRCCWEKRLSEAGEVAVHPRCKIAFYDQTLQQLPNNANLVEGMVTVAETLGVDLRAEDCEKIIIGAGFKYSQLQQKVSQLSGGERARLLLTSLSQAKSNLLMLDEPTNHLDLYGRNELSNQLQSFNGALLLVSHDRHLVEATCNRFWVVQNGALQEVNDVEAAYSMIAATEPKPQVDPSVLKESVLVELAETAIPSSDDAEETLERLIELEELMEADLARRPNRQSPHLHGKWKDEIEQLQKHLELGN
ncbi:putative ABC transporter ATP-binding protein YheS [Pseudovibrio axinellae]|uniref:Putative ABC transporter ATP-binding protein YheS n=1 Tax=Pseudovibrio axinellae TaxID=989403 RepID=A0A165ZGN9_9HYPH|nr:ABC-F family ATP-binding cassette domain-containing protein [Pseudovibrio axinellae]KZL19879.1 putative ABC transporter ATP-binding protein YheS [Pseudovibrio axinellae]SER38400.1 ATPase components of ABC transporters with duplicated ATPase domains [Pseudovibrio axinellae]